MVYEIYDRFAHLNDTDIGREALELYGMSIAEGRSEDEAEVIASNVNAAGGVSIRAA